MRANAKGTWRRAIGLLMALLAVATADAVTFPLSNSADGRYFVDATGTPFRVQGEASWDAHINLDLTALRAYLDNRQAKGINTLFTYATNPVAYYVGSSAPWARQLGGSAAGAAALPFTLNVSGTAWDGDPFFNHFDASFAAPNDAYFAWLAQFIDEANARGMVVMLTPTYLGYGLGDHDGWYRTMAQNANTRAVCFAFGQYLANGHGVFGGLKNKPNIVWIAGGDTMPPTGSEVAIRSLQVIQGLRAAGDTHPLGAHWQHDYSPALQGDYASLLASNAVYTHGPYPSPGPTYAMSRAIYATTPAKPAWLIETNYWGDHGASRADLRYYSWGAALSTIGGVTFGFGPLWGFATSADGSNNTALSETTAWRANATYERNDYVSRAGRWYRATNAGTTSASPPTGTGSAIVDGGVVWTHVGAGGIEALYDEPAVLDFARMGALLDSLPWHRLVPSGLDGTSNWIVSGTGTYASWSDTGFAAGGMDWVVAAATRDGRWLLAYVPDAHAGAFGVNLGALAGAARARWYDPTNGAMTTIGTFAASGTQAFTSPGANAAGANDWVLVLDVQGTDDALFANGFEP